MNVRLYKKSISSLDVDATAIANEFHVPFSQAKQMYADTFRHGASWEREITMENGETYMVALDSNGMSFVIVN